MVTLAGAFHRYASEDDALQQSLFFLECALALECYKTAVNVENLPSAELQIELNITDLKLG